MPTYTESFVLPERLCTVTNKMQKKVLVTWALFPENSTIIKIVSSQKVTSTKPTTPKITDQHKRPTMWSLKTLYCIIQSPVLAAHFCTIETGLFIYLTFCDITSYFSRLCLFYCWWDNTEWSEGFLNFAVIPPKTKYIALYFLFILH